MKASLLFLLLVVSALSVKAAPNTSPELDDLMTLDELAYEVAKPPRTEMHPVISPESIAEHDGIDIYKEYAIVLHINKSALGPGAQHMQVFEGGNQTYDWPISTGREQYEKAKSGRWYWTVTPAGTFSPYKLERDHYSSTWDAHMEYAAFFIGGVAVHATTPDHYKQLGQRASGGCVRLRKDNAQVIWEKISAQPQALVPLFAANGRVARDLNGNPIRVMGWNTLIIVDGK
ncbi:MAG TPA: L,D-transpeptidase [Bdellovibrio sp.]|uniref:L,D-transpeptidase n=1 Tax=Bdellovibrio sp. TaxID=28201 RepID=UPI002F054D27